MERFRRIYREFGTGVLIRTLILLFGLIGMAVLGVVLFDSLVAAGVAAIGVLLGWVFRYQIPKGADYYTTAVPIGLGVYAAVLFAGDRLGLDRNIKLLVITFTTVVVFNLKFWTLSHPNVVNASASREW